MPYKSLIVIAIIALTLGFMWLDRTSITPDDTATVAGSAAFAPDVTFTLLDGKTLKLRSLAGHKILLHFWASWCAPCRLEFSELLKRVKKEGNGTILLAVSGDAKAEDAKRFLSAYRREFAPLFASGNVIIAHDPHHALIEGVFQTFKYPETIIIAPNLTMQHKVVGMMDTNI